MKKLDISLVKKYVNGEDLGTYSSEQLETDKDFMMGVISYTNDSKMYNFCSDELKKDYGFVKYLVLKFKDNSKFIINVADYYLDNTNEDLERRELSIIMEKLLPIDLSNKYEIMNSAVYLKERVDFELAKRVEPKLESVIGMGFWLIFDSYNSSEIIINYYAESLINEIIRDNDINFENMLHNQFKRPEEISKVGLNNYVMRLIGHYDSMLSSYISTHLDLISNITNKIKHIQFNWDRYNNTEEAKRYNNMLDMVHEYMHMSKSNMTETEILYYVAKELGIKDKVEHYGGSCEIDEDLEYNEELMDDVLYEQNEEEMEEVPWEEDIDFDEEMVMDDMVKSEIEGSIKERQIYLIVKKMMVNQLFSNKPLDLYSLLEEEGQNSSTGESKCKIIKLKPTN